MATTDVLMLRVTELTTTRADLTEQEGVFIILTGRAIGPLEPLLALVRAQKAGHPIVAIAVQSSEEELAGVG